VLSRRNFLIGGLGLGAVSVPAGWYGAVYEPNDIEVVRQSVTIRQLPPRLDGIRAVQISDLHMHTTTDLHLNMLRQIQAINPELVLVTGDLIDTSSAVADVVELLSNLKPSLGTWVVPGNWDHTAGAVDALSQNLQATNVHFLINRSAALDDGFWIVGVDDPATGMDDLRGAVKKVPAGVPRILLAHSPDIVRTVDSPCDLILVGHTHGGQINLPGLSGAWLHNGPSKRYVRGLYDIDGIPMYVNRGIGTTTVPIRIGSRPEITEFTFHAA
jgi:predicted MPP superfamily phosphohydrolase